MPWRRTVLAFKPDVLHIQSVPQSHYDIINEGPISTVSRTWTKIEDGEPQWVVVKTATTYRKFGKEPHDVVKELRILAELSHINIIQILGSFHDEDESVLNMYMPYIAISLRDLLSSPFFSPHPFPPLRLSDPDTCVLEDEQFTVLAKSIMAQTLCALAYLHNEDRRIAHRDIKPENLLLTRDGCVKLIDFGTVWKDAEPDEEKTWDLWPEYREGLYFEVSTGAYRAPELLFGVRNYDPVAIDLWSIGATFSEFFTTLRLVSDDDEEEEDEEEKTAAEKAAPLPPFVIPRYLRIGYPGTQWRRDTLYNGDRGEIGLAWSIFKIHGTPTPENWPEFDEFPGAKSVVFNEVPAVPLQPLLPNLPISSRTPLPSPAPPSVQLSSSMSPLRTSTQSSSSSVLTPFPSLLTLSPSPVSQTQHTSALSLLTQFLVYPTAKRLSARSALRHAWFTRVEGVGLLLPPGYPMEALLEAAYPQEQERVPSPAEVFLSPYEVKQGHEQLKSAKMESWRGKTLKECLDGVLVRIPGS